MNSDLRSLIKLQETDLKIMGLEKRNNEIPHQTALLNEQLKKHEEDLTRVKQKLTDLQKERRKMEGEVELHRTKLSKYKDQLMEVKTNKEYAAVLKEIEVAKKEIDGLENKILDFMEEIERTEREQKDQESKLKIEREKVAAQQKELATISESIKQEIIELNAAKGDTLRAISPELVEKYRQIASKRKGIALAEAKDETCQVCFVRLRPQVFTDVKKNQHIIACESCDRILYWAVYQT